MAKVNFEVDGEQRSLKVKRFYNEDDYVFWMSHYAHEKKRLGIDGFVEKYKEPLIKEKRVKLRYCYLAAYIEWLTGERFKEFDRFTMKKLVLSVFGKDWYFKEKDDKYLYLDKAIPCFLRHNLIITKVQEAVPTPPPGMDLFAGK